MSLQHAMPGRLQQAMAGGSDRARAGILQRTMANGPYGDNLAPSSGRRPGGA
jgi:hypothetical protein